MPTPLTTDHFILPEEPGTLRAPCSRKAPIEHSPSTPERTHEFRPPIGEANPSSVGRGSRNEPEVHLGVHEYRSVQSPRATARRPETNPGTRTSNFPTARLASQREAHGSKTNPATPQAGSVFLTRPPWSGDETNPVRDVPEKTNPRTLRSIPVMTSSWLRPHPTHYQTFQGPRREQTNPSIRKMKSNRELNRNIAM